MFFDDVSEITTIAAHTSTAVFVLPKTVEIHIKNSIIIQPEDRTVITIEQIRQIVAKLNTKQQTDQYIIIRPADLMNDEAANAFLKNLEEPKPKIHFLLITDSPSKLLPTILSRSALYVKKQSWAIDSTTIEDEKLKKLAKRLISAKGSDLVALAEEISKQKTAPRDHAQQVLSLAIEMLYKTFLITNKPAFLKKADQLITAYDNIAKNGHIKLHLVADLC